MRLSAPLRAPALAAALALAAGLVTLATLPVLPTMDTPVFLRLTPGFGPTGPESDIVYPPAYPGFLGVLLKLAGPENLPLAAAAVQHVLSALSVGLLCATGARIGRPGAGLFTGIVLALYLPRSLYAQSLGNETPFLFLAAAFAFTLAGAPGDPRARRAAACGALAGAAILVKPAGALLLLAAAAVFARTPRRALLAFAVAALVAGAALPYHRAVFGRAVFSDCFGRHLADQAYAFALAPRDPGAESLRTEVLHTGKPAVFPGFWWDYWSSLRATRTARETDRLLLSCAARTLAADPAGFAGRAALNTWLNVVWWDPRLPSVETALDREKLKAWLSGRIRSARPGDAPGWWSATHAEQGSAPAVGFRPAPRLTGHAGEAWVRLAGRGLLRFRGPYWAAAWTLALAAGFLAGGGARIVALCGIVLAGAGAFEGVSPRYFEWVFPFALLSLATAAEDAVQTLRTIFPKF